MMRGYALAAKGLWLARTLALMEIGEEYDGRTPRDTGKDKEKRETV